MTLSIELTPESEERLNRAARQAGVKPEDFARSLIEALPLETMKQERAEGHQVEETEARRIYTASELLKMPAEQRSRYLQVAAENAATEYETDLALPVRDRELTAFSGIAGVDLLNGSVDD